MPDWNEHISDEARKRIKKNMMREAEKKKPGPGLCLILLLAMITVAIIPGMWT